MNAESTQISGFTHEGYEVRNLPLSFCMISINFADFPKAALQIAIEFNSDERKRKRPYLCINLFGILIQSGWLF